MWSILRRSLLPGCAAISVLTAGIFCAILSLANAQGNAPSVWELRPVIPLLRSVPAVVSRATFLGHLDPQQTLSVIVSLKFAQPAQAQAYADAVSNPLSLQYHQFLTPAEIRRRFGPTETDYQAVITYLQAHSLHIQNMPANRMTVHALGTAAQIEEAFGTRLNRYQEGDVDRVRRAGPNGQALTFFANAAPIQLPPAFAARIQGVAGLESYAQPRHKVGRAAAPTAPYAPDAIRIAYDTTPIYNAAGPMRGDGRSVGIVAFGHISTTDLLDYISHFSLPTPAQQSSAGNVTFVDINGGAPVKRRSDSETDLDVQMVLGMAPLANILVYDTNGGSSSAEVNYLALLTQIVSDDAVDIVSDSNGWDIPDSTTVSQLHDQYLMMTLEGITYLNASGDDGSDLSYFYPETDTEVLAVGGTILTLDGSDHIQSETGWDGSGGGYYTQGIFTRPDYQTGRSVPTNINYRLVPDIALHAAGANSAGAYQYYWGGALQTGDVGTSFASPVCAGCLALVEQSMIHQNALPADTNGHRRLGRLQDALYAFNGRNDVFHDITVGKNDTSSDFPNGFSSGPYWDFVTGWGSLDFYNLSAALAAPLAVSVTPNSAQVQVGTSLPLQATVQGSNIQTVVWSLASGSGTLASNGVYTAPDAVTTSQTVRIRATSTLDTATPVYGEATLTIVSGTPGITSQPIDFNADGKPDLVFQNTSAQQMAVWYMDNANRLDAHYLLPIATAGWTCVGVADFNKDGNPDLLWQNVSTGQLAVWYMNATTALGGVVLSLKAPAGWNVVAITDMNQDGWPDLVFQNSTTGQLSCWLMRNSQILTGVYITPNPPSGWTCVGAADFNQDGKSDLLFQNVSTGQLAVWYMNGTNALGGVIILTKAALGWKVVAVADMNQDGNPDLIFQNSMTGQLAIWHMSGVTATDGVILGITLPAGWVCIGPQ